MEKLPFSFWLPRESARLPSAGHDPEEEQADLGVCSRLSLSNKDDGCKTRKETRICISLIAQGQEMI